MKHYTNYEKEQLKLLSIHYESSVKDTFYQNWNNALQIFFNIFLSLIILALSSIISLSITLIEQSKNIIEDNRKIAELTKNIISDIGSTFSDFCNIIFWFWIIYFVISSLFGIYKSSIYKRYVLIKEILNENKK